MRPGVDYRRVHLPSWLFEGVLGLLGSVIGGVTDTGAGAAGVAECQDPDISGPSLGHLAAFIPTAPPVVWGLVGGWLMAGVQRHLASEALQLKGRNRGLF